MENMEAVEVIEGPFWDFSAASGYFQRQRNMCARLSAERVLSGDIARATEWAMKYAAATESLEAVDARWDSLRDDELYWIGWRGGYSRSEL